MNTHTRTHRVHLYVCIISLSLSLCIYIYICILFIDMYIAITYTCLYYEGGRVGPSEARAGRRLETSRSTKVEMTS